MIHITHEGEPFRLGFNIGWSARRWNHIWFRFVWAWVDLPRKRGIKYRFRVRFFHWPHIFIWDRSEHDLVAEWVQTFDVVVLTREMAEDFHIPRGLCLMDRLGPVAGGPSD